MRIIVDIFAIGYVECRAAYLRAIYEHIPFCTYYAADKVYR